MHTNSYYYWIGVTVGMIAWNIGRIFAKWVASKQDPPKRYFVAFYAAYSTDTSSRVYGTTRYCLSSGETISLDKIANSIKNGQSTKVDVVQITSIYEFKTKKEYDEFHK